MENVEYLKTTRGCNSLTNEAHDYEEEVEKMEKFNIKLMKI